MKKLNAVLPVVAGLLVLSACGGTSGSVTDSAGTGSNRPADSSAAGSVTTEAATTTAAANPMFGAAYTFDNGVAVTVSAPAPYTPSASAFVQGGSSAVAFDVTIVNGGTENYDPVLFSATVQSGNTEAQQIFDSENAINGAPSTAVLPGRETAFKLAYSVTDPADLVMQLSPGFEFDPVFFTS